METIHSCPDWLETDWTGKMERLAQAILHALGCFEPPVSKEVLFPTAPGQPQTNPGPGGTSPLKIQPKAVLEVALRVMAKEGLKLPENDPKFLAYLVNQVLAPSEWMLDLWRQKQNLADLVKAFPCLQGEQFAKRLAECLTSAFAMEIGWVQGGKLIWRQAANRCSGTLEMTSLEARCWQACRDFSRYTDLQNHRIRVQCWPWHRIFPRGELLVSQTQEFMAETD